MNNLFVEFSSFFVVSSGDPPVVHVIPQMLWVFLEQGAEISVHSSLEERGGIGEAEVHNPRYLGALWGFECCFVLIFLRDANVVIAPSDIEL
jgi:hypothetical protein